MTLALFDFDGTLTYQDTFTRFLFYSTPKWRLALGMAFIWPLLLLYKLGYLKAPKLRPVLAWLAFAGRTVESVQRQADAFLTTVLAQLMRPDMMQKLHWHQQQGHRVVLVSASLNPYLECWCRQHNVERVCSQLAIGHGRYTGRYVGGDCSGANKVLRLRELLTPEAYATIYAYGDTVEDFPLLQLAQHRVYRGKAITQLPNE